MWPFPKKKKNYIGIDLGAGGIKLVELFNEKGRARLFTYAFTEKEFTREPISFIEDSKNTALLLQKMIRKARTSTTRVVSGLPLVSVYSRVITVPNGTPQEIQEAVKWQAKKLVPAPLEEMVYEFKQIGDKQKTAKGTEKAVLSAKKNVPEKEVKEDASSEALGSVQKSIPVLFTGAMKTTVAKYTQVFKLAGLELVALETETFALIRSLVGRERSVSMIVDIGAFRTNIIIVENGVPYETRSITTGGAVFTEAIAKAMNISPIAAEKLKRDAKQAMGGVESPKIFEHIIQPIVLELKLSMERFLESSIENGEKEKVVEKIILTGGGAELPGLTENLSKTLNVKAYLGDPWGRVVYPPELRGTLDVIGPRFSVASGLAMRDIE